MSVCTRIAIALPFVSASPFLREVPLIPDFSAGRYLLFTVFFVCVSAAIGVRFLTVCRFGSGKNAAYVGLLAALLIDLGTTTFQQPYAQHISGLDAMAEDDVPGELLNFRGISTLRGRNAYDEMVVTQMVRRIPSAMAPHPGDLLAQTYFVKPLENVFTIVLPDSMGDLDWGRLEKFQTGFKMLNVRRLGLVLPHAAWFDWHSPLLVSSRTVILPKGDRLTQETVSSSEARDRMESMRDNPEDDDWIKRVLSVLWILNHSVIDEDRGSVDAIVLEAGGRAVDLGSDPECSVLEHNVWNTRARMRVRVSEDCYTRLSYAYYPYLDVLVDGDRVEPMVTAGRFIALKLSAGTHTIELIPRLSPLRRWFWFAAVLSVLGWFGWGREKFRNISTETSQWTKA